jgi:hypothetical protein
MTDKFYCDICKKLKYGDYILNYGYLKNREAFTKFLRLYPELRFEDIRNDIPIIEGNECKDCFLSNGGECNESYWYCIVKNHSKDRKELEKFK